MQVFRLVGGLRDSRDVGVDRVIAFDELPERFVADLEMRAPDGMTPAWKAWLPKIKKRIPGMKFALQSGGFQVVPDRYEEGPYFYILEYAAVNKDIERWNEIASFVKRAVDASVRLPDKLEEMSIPLAADVKSELNIHDPANEVPVIKIPLELQEKVVPIPVSNEIKNIPAFEDNGDKLKHSEDCKTQGRGGRLADEGKCPRCDQMRGKKLVTAGA